MNAFSASDLIFISSAFFLNEGSLHFQMKIRLLAKPYLLSPRYFLFCICGQWEIPDLQQAQENIFLPIHPFLSIIFFKVNKPGLWYYIYSQRQRVFLEIAATLCICCWVLTAAEYMPWYRGMSRAVQVCCLCSSVTCCFPHLGLSSQPVQAAMRFAHRSSLRWWDDVCAWGSREKGQADAVAGNTNAQTNVPRCPWAPREAAGFFSAALSEPWSCRFRCISKAELLSAFVCNLLLPCC